MIRNIKLLVLLTADLIRGNMAKRYLTIKEKRSALRYAYSNDEDWKEKVDHMPTNMICGIFENLRKDGLINFDGDGNIYYRSRAEVNELKKRRREARVGHQVTLDEFLKQEEQKIIQNNRKEIGNIKHGKVK